MEIRDPVHGSLPINNELIPVIEHPFFRRLRNIKQLGLTEFVFPGATHTRFIHSLGVMNISQMAFKKIFKDQSDNTEFIKLRETLKLGCLLHDIGHAPLSHSTEKVMPQLSELKLPSEFQNKDNRQANHEDYTIKTITDSDLTSSLEKSRKQFGVEPNRVADLVLGKTQNPEYFTIQGKNYFPILHQLVSSELDCDRMDYLLRDSYFCGVSYGNFDLDWILDNLKPCELDNQVFLGISERAVSTFDDFLLSRYHMFIMVYFHYKSVCMEQLLNRYFQTSNEYSIPADISEYRKHDDHHLMSVLRESDNRYAKDIVNYRIPPKVYESFNPRQLSTLEQLQHYLKSEGIDFIRCSSKGRLSKYYNQSNDEENCYSIKVAPTYLSNKNNYIDIDNATGLYRKYSETHSVNRLHCWKEDLSQDQEKQIEQIIHG